MEVKDSFNLAINKSLLAYEDGAELSKGEKVTEGDQLLTNIQVTAKESNDDKATSKISFGAYMKYFGLFCLWPLLRLGKHHPKIISRFAISWLFVLSSILLNTFHLTL